jgi:hypothetical protein
VILVHPALAVRIAVGAVIWLRVWATRLLRVSVFAWVLSRRLWWLGGERRPQPCAEDQDDRDDE